MKIRQLLFIHGQEANSKQITQVSDVYVNFHVESDFDHIHDVLPNFANKQNSLIFLIQFYTYPTCSELPPI